MGVVGVRIAWLLRRHWRATLAGHRARGRRRGGGGGRGRPPGAESVGGPSSDRLGVVSPAVVPLAALLLVVVAAVLFANLVALWPGRRAAAIRPAEALRSE